MYNTGLVSISFRKHSPAEIIAASKSAGLSCIEWGSDVHAPAGDEKTARDIAARMADAGLFTCSYGTYFRAGVHPAEGVYEYIRTARILGTDTLRIWAGDGFYEDYQKQGKKELFDAFRALAAIGEKEGVTFCTECHVKTYTESLEGAREMFGEIDSPRLLGYWQPSQFKTVEENLAYARAMAPKTTHIHVFQWRNPKVIRYPLSEGAEEWKNYLRCFEGDRCLLLEFMPDDRIETLKREADSLREIIAGV